MNAARTQELLDRVAYEDWRFVATDLVDGTLLVRAFFVADDASNPGIFYTQETRPWVVPTTATDSDVFRTALALVLLAEEHETREKFLVDGRPAFGPHQPVETA